MSTSVKQQGLGPRRPSFLESGSNPRSAMILTSAQTNRDGLSTAFGSGYENTYALEPQQRASSHSMRNVVKTTLEDQLTGREYRAEDAPGWARNISDQIKQRAKSLGLPRYKFVCLVSIGPLDHASVAMTSRCLWNSKVDTYAEYVFQNSSIYAVGLLYGVYCE